MASNRAHSFTSIPQLDLSQAETIERPLLISQLRHALTRVGFLYVINHGVPDKAINNLVETLPVLFSLPPDAKKEVALENSPHFLGYSGAGSETTAGKVDQREQFEYATELSNGWTEGVPLYERLRGPNQVGQTRSVPVKGTYWRASCSGPLHTHNFARLCKVMSPNLAS